MAKIKTIQEQKEELLKQMKEIEVQEERQKAAQEKAAKKQEEAKAEIERLIPLPPEKDAVEVNLGLGRSLKIIMVLCGLNTFLFLLWITLLFVI